MTPAQEISHALHGSAAEAFWTGTSYLLTSAVFQPVIAKAAYCFGRRRLLIVSIVLFSFGTALCAVAHDFAVMLVGRCVQGVGGGGIIALTQVIFCDMVPLRQRPQYFSMVLGAWSVGSIIGPVVGGSLVETASWRWCFYINFPFCGVGLAAATLFVRPDGEGDDIDDYYTSGTLTERVQRMDWLGALLFVAGMTSLLVGISWGGTQHPWASAATLVPVVAGVLTTAVFVAWQVHVQPQSLLPTTLFYNVSSVAAFYCALVNGLVVSLSPARAAGVHVVDRTSVAVHRAVLHPVLPSVGAGLGADPCRHRSVPRRLSPHPRIGDCRLPHLASRPVSMGSLAGLGRHRRRVRPVCAVR
jgi:MFS family permease